MRGRPVMRAAIWCAVAACGNDVCGVPEVRGAGIERDIAQDEVDRFFAAILAPMCVLRFEIGVSNGEGSYHLREQSIEVDSGLVEDRLRHVVRHELCHAVQEQSGFDVSDGELWFEPVGAPRKRMAQESFADTCDVGPLALHLVGDPCATDPVGSEVFAQVAPLFRPPDELVRAPQVTRGPPVAAAALGATWLRSITPAEGGVLRLDYTDEHVSSTVAYVDLWTGEPRGLAAPAPTLAAAVPAGDDVTVADAVLPEAQISEVVVLPGNGASVRRLAFHDEAGWARLDCPGGATETAFAADGALWWAVLAPDAIRWGRWSLDVE